MEKQQRECRLSRNCFSSKSFVVPSDVHRENWLSSHFIPILCYSIFHPFCMAHATEDPVCLTSESTWIEGTGNDASWFKINGVEGRAERILGHELLIESRIHDKLLWISDLLGKRIQRNKNQDASYENYLVVVLYDEMGLRLLACSHWLAT